MGETRNDGRYHARRYAPLLPTARTRFDWYIPCREIKSVQKNMEKCEKKEKELTPDGLPDYPDRHGIANLKKQSHRRTNFFLSLCASSLHSPFARSGFLCIFHDESIYIYISLSRVLASRVYSAPGELSHFFSFFFHHSAREWLTECVIHIGNADGNYAAVST